MSTFSALKIELIGIGEQPGTWGDTTNTNFDVAVSEAITGRAEAQFPTNGNHTLLYENNNGTQVFRNLVLNVTSAVNLTATRDLVIPAIQKQYIVENKTSGGQSIVVKTAAGSGVTIPHLKIAHIYCDGTDTRFADDYVDINGGSIDGTPIGAASASTGAFTTITATAASITGGAVDDTPIGATTPSTGAFTTVTATSATLTAASITGGAVNGTPIGATTPSTGAFTTATITTGNITTGNIKTLNVGTQTNKATISYTTDAARTLAIPAVSGNRTFAFLEEAQTFTADQTLQSNLIFDGNTRRIKGNFIPYSSDGTYFQTSLPNMGTSLGIISNGGNNNSSLVIYAGTDPANTNFVSWYASPIGSYVDSGSVGTGTTQDFSIVTNGGTRLRVSPSGDVAINASNDTDVSLKVNTGGTRTYSLETNDKVKHNNVYGNTVAANNRYVYIGDDGVIGGLVPSLRAAKTNITPITDTSWLMALEPVSYNRRLTDANGAYTDTFYPVTEYGLIADDVEPIRPEMCLFEEGALAGLKYEQLITPMLREIQKLRAEVNALKEKLNG